jgi:hypothetical protein
MEGKKIFNSPAARYFAHVVIAFAATFFPMEYAAHSGVSKSLLYGAFTALARAVAGATTSINPNVGKNVV